MYLPWSFWKYYSLKNTFNGEYKPIQYIFAVFMSGMISMRQDLRLRSTDTLSDAVLFYFILWKRTIRKEYKAQFWITMMACRKYLSASSGRLSPRVFLGMAGRYIAERLWWTWYCRTVGSWAAVMVLQQNGVYARGKRCPQFISVLIKS